MRTGTVNGGAGTSGDTDDGWIRTPGGAVYPGSGRAAGMLPARYPASAPAGCSQVFTARLIVTQSQAAILFPAPKLSAGVGTVWVAGGPGCS